MIEMNFYEKLQKLRKRNGLSQEQLAGELGVSRQAVSKWESGQGYPEIDKIILLSDIFKVSLDDLLREDNHIAVNNDSIKLDLKDIWILINRSFKKISYSYQIIVWMVIICTGIIIVFGALNLIYTMGAYIGKLLNYAYSLHF
ncbi:helix-turn-helix domain-containing protein [Geosporobacter ferrireducens]|nr:helix-turn-helix transcriptional regulator [Geosporobacter ferrireducens]